MPYVIQITGQTESKEFKHRSDWPGLVFKHSTHFRFSHVFHQASSSKALQTMTFVASAETMDRDGFINMTPGADTYDLSAEAVPALAATERILAFETSASAYPPTCDRGAFTHLTPLETTL
jgi:hypothetical protein